MEHVLLIIIYCFSLVASHRISTSTYLDPWSGVCLRCELLSNTYVSWLCRCWF